MLIIPLRLPIREAKLVRVGWGRIGPTNSRGLHVRESTTGATSAGTAAIANTSVVRAKGFLTIQDSVVFVGWAHVVG